MKFAFKIIPGAPNAARPSASGNDQRPGREETQSATTKTTRRLGRPTRRLRRARSGNFCSSERRFLGFLIWWSFPKRPSRRDHPAGLSRHPIREWGAPIDSSVSAQNQSRTSDRNAPRFVAEHRLSSYWSRNKSRKPAGYYKAAARWNSIISPRARGGVGCWPL